MINVTVARICVYMCIWNSVARFPLAPIKYKYRWITFIRLTTTFRKKLLVKTCKNVYTLIFLGFWFFHILPIFNNFLMLFFTFSSISLQIIDNSYYVLVVPLYVIHLQVYSLLCPIHLLFVLFYLPSIACHFTV